MNREIKFAGQDFYGTWHYGYYCKDYAGVNYITTLDGVSTIQVKGSTIRQFTGLKDKNGKEIYEGDILHFQTYESGGFLKIGIDCYAEVVFGNHNLTDESLYRSQGFYILTGKSHHPTSIHYWLNSHKAVVAGNVHQNPELLKGGDENE